LSVVDNGVCIKLAEPCKAFAGIEQAGIEEVRADPTRFERKLAEAQGLAADGKIEEVALIVLHTWRRHSSRAGRALGNSGMIPRHAHYLGEPERHPLGGKQGIF